MSYKMHSNVDEEMVNIRFLSKEKQNNQKRCNMMILIGIQIGLNDRMVKCYLEHQFDKIGQGKVQFILPITLWCDIL